MAVELLPRTDAAHKETSRPGRTEKRRKVSRQTIWIWAFLAPTIVLYGAYTLYPAIASYWFSFVSWDGFGNDRTFVGLANYKAALADPLFWNTFKVTLIFMVIVAPARILGAFILAVILNSPKMPFATLFRTMFFLPVVTTTAIIGVVMQLILDPGSGPLNEILRMIGIAPEGGLNLLGNKSTALLTAGGVYVWKQFGITMIYWLAALQTIPREVYEAASTDGANAFQTFWHITAPMLKPFLIIISLLTIEDALRSFDLMQSMTGGGPFFGTEVVEIYIYRWGFAASIPQLGFASAAAVIFGLFAFVLGALQIWGVYAAGKMRAGS